MSFNELKERHQKLIFWVNGIWGLICLMIIMALIGVCIFWLSQPNFFYSITNANNKPHIVSTEGAIYHPNILISGTGRADYEQWIENRAGKIVYTYETVTLNNESNTQIRQERVTIPRLPAGTYIIKGRMNVTPNPLRNFSIALVIGVIEVRDKNETEDNILHHSSITIQKKIND